jgi:hypothetical protein
MKKLLAAISAILLLLCPRLDSLCCPPDIAFDDQAFLLFQPNLSGMAQLAPLYYYPLYAGAFVSDPEGIDKKKNCKEWSAYTGYAVSEKDIYNVQYNLSPDAFLNAYRHGDWESLADNSFIHWLRMPAHKDALDYFAFAKTAEFMQFGDMNPWNVKGAQSLSADTLMNTGMDKCGKVSSFLNGRYAFQVLRLSYYNGLHETACYEKYLQQSNSIVAVWGEFFYALMMQNDSLLMDVFDKSEEKRGFIYDHVTKKTLATLANGQSHTAATAIVLQALHNPGRALPDLQKLYTIEPENKFLPLLVSREVNKLEDWTRSLPVLGFNPVEKMQAYDNKKYAQTHRDTDNDTTYSYYAQKNLTSDQEYLRTVRSFLAEQLPHAGNQQTFLKLAVAHLYNIDGEFAMARTYLSNIQGNTTVQKQAIIESFIAAINTDDLTKPDVKQALYEQLHQLEKLGDQLELGSQSKEYPNGTATWWPFDRAPKHISDQLCLLLSQRYKERGDIVTAGLLFRKASVQVNDYFGGYTDEVLNTGNVKDAASYDKIAYFDKYASPADVDALLQFRHKAHKTDFETMITPQYWGPDDFYRDLKTTILTRKGQFKDALAVADSINDRFWEDNYDYRFYLSKLYIASAGMLVPKEDTTKRYAITSKKSILKDIVALQDSLKNAPEGPAKARYYYLLGNASFNISYHGRNWMMFSYGKSAAETIEQDHDNYNWAWFSFYPNSQTYGATYYQCADAEAYYKKALSYAGDQPELSAKAVMMLSVCDVARKGENYVTSSNGIRHYLPYSDKPYYSPYLKTLKARYGNTNIFAESITQCPDVADYVKKYP